MLFHKLIMIDMTVHFYRGNVEVSVTRICRLFSKIDLHFFLFRFHRSITRPFFTKDRISDFELFERHTDEALRKAKARLAEGYPIDFQVRMNPST